MAKRVVAAIAAMVVAGALLAAPAAAQTYPPPTNSITVDDATVTPGQRITITLQTCRPRTIALLGIGISLVATPTVNADGVARATVTVPRWLRSGRHVVSGACLDRDFRPLFLTTTILVSGSGSTGGSGGGGSGSGSGSGGSGSSGGSAGGAPLAAPPAEGGSGGTDAGGSAGSGGSGGGGAGGLGDLAGPQVPADAPAIFEEAAEANGVADGGAPAGAPANAQQPSTAATSGDDPSVWATIARVVLGISAIAGVPAALALSRRPQKVMREGFA